MKILLSLIGIAILSCATSLTYAADQRLDGNNQPSVSAKSTHFLTLAVATPVKKSPVQAPAKAPTKAK